MIYYPLGYNRYRFIFANTAVATALAVLIFTNAKMFKFLRRQVDQWDSIHDSSVDNPNGEEADYEMGKKDNKDTSDRVIVILSMLSAVMHLYLHH